MERMRTVAFQTVGRAVGFAGLAILCVMAGFAFDPLLAVQSGGVLVLLVLAVLLFKARMALTADHRQTEMWLYLDKHEKPPEAYAHWAAATVLRDAYFWFARWMAAIAVALWGMALLMPLFGVGHVDPFASQPAG
jgi:type IV secretory pathway VirB3-like protein